MLLWDYELSWQKVRVGTLVYQASGVGSLPSRGMIDFSDQYWSGVDTVSINGYQTF